MQFPGHLARVRFAGIVHRVVRDGVDPLSTQGSRNAGGRYNLPGNFGALYTSMTAATAQVEIERGLRLRGINPTAYPASSWWDYELETTLEAVLDLTDPDVLAALGLGPDALITTEVGPTREIAAEARSRGYQGLLVPSAAEPGSKNLVVFDEAISGRVRVLHSRPVEFQRR